MPGPPRRVTDEMRKKQKAAQAKRRRAESIRIGDKIDTWKKIREDYALKTDGELAGMLIACFLESPEGRKRKKPCPESESSSSIDTYRIVKVEPEDESQYEDDDDDSDDIPSEWNTSMNMNPQSGEILDMSVKREVPDIDDPVEEEINRAIEPSRQGVHLLNHITPAVEEDPMYLVSSSCLNTLTDFVPYNVCTKPGCQEITVRKKLVEGSGVKLRWECRNGHTSYSWASQAVLPNGDMLGNFKLGLSILLSGNDYSKIALLFKFLRAGFPSKSSFQRFQESYAVPVINNYWANLKQSSEEEHRDSADVVSGDGNTDSPGHSSSFCT